MRAVSEYRRRRQARRWQRWTEVEPEADFARLAGIIVAIAVTFMLVLFVLIVVGLVLALS